MDDRPRFRPTQEGSGHASDKGRMLLTILGVVMITALLSVPVLGFINFLYEKEARGLPWE